MKNKISMFFAMVFLALVANGSAQTEVQEVKNEVVPSVENCGIDDEKHHTYVEEKLGEKAGGIANRSQPSCILKNRFDEIGVQVIVDNLEGRFWTSAYNDDQRAALLAQTKKTVEVLNDSFSFLDVTFVEDRYEEVDDRKGERFFSDNSTIRILFRAEDFPGAHSCGEMRYAPDRGEHYVYVNLTAPGCGYLSLDEGIDTEAILKTLVHEMGHYFGLFHTHASSDTYLAERVDRNHMHGNSPSCNIWGDGFCDTPADPNLASMVDANSCAYTGNKKDHNGDRFEPDTSNHMSYSLTSCKNTFSEQQQASAKEFLDKLVCPGNTIVPIDVPNVSLAYPNPFSEQITIPVNSGAAGVEIINKQGKTVATFNPNQYKENSTYAKVVEWRPDASLPAGMYIVRFIMDRQSVRNNKGAQVIKIIKQ